MIGNSRFKRNTAINNDERQRRFDVIDRPNTLKEKLNGPAVGMGVINPEAIARAETAIEQSRDHYLQHAEEMVTTMREALKGLRTNRKESAQFLAALYRHSREMKGQAGTFGFPLLTRFGDSLSELTQKMTVISNRQIELIDAHLNAMDVVISQKVEGSGGAVGEELSAGLRRAIQRVVAEQI